jgi:hypothetical protein
MAFIMKKNDTLPWLRATLRQGNAEPIDLTEADIVKFIAKSQGVTKLITKTALIVDAVSGLVEVRFAASDTDVAGTFDCEFEITWEPGYLQTVPNDGYFNIVIVQDLG